MSLRTTATLQRKCACGHIHAGPCQSCRKEKPRQDAAARQPSITCFAGHARSGHDFSKLPLSSAGAATTRQGIASVGNGWDELVPKSKTGDCLPGRSESKCIDGVGYMTTTIDNDCCTRPCTIEHEALHVRELDACCKAFHRARKATGADQEKVIETWGKWMEQARPVSECHAYANDVSCAAKLAIMKGCTPERERRGSEVASGVAPAGAASEPAENVQATAQEGNEEAAGTGRIGELIGCCNDITAYADVFEHEMNYWCGLAKGRSIPPCPFTGNPGKP
jgi:hypothetical protein